MLFSVVVPIYNVEDYLDFCLKSIQNQTYFDFECILVDDGSTDRSSEICDRYCRNDKRFTVVHKRNGGLVSARIEGAKLAQGEYVICVDGDDWLNDKFLFEFADIAKKLKPDIICCGMIRYRSDHFAESVKINVSEGFYNRKRIEETIFPFLIHDELGKYFPPSLWAKAFRRSLYQLRQFSVNPQIKIGEDIACTYACICACNSIYCMDKCLYYYRRNEQSMTHRKVFDLLGPKMIGEHLLDCTVESDRDFKPQINRMVVHLLFNCCVIQFYRIEKYSVICRELDGILRDPFYDEAIRECLFSKRYIKGKLALLALKHRMFLLIKIYSMIK